MAISKEYIKKDLKRYSFAKKKGTKRFDLILQFIFNYGFQATLVYRFGQWIFDRQNGGVFYYFHFILFPFYSFLNMGIKYLYGISLSRKANIGPGLFIGHFGNIKIGKCILGENCSIQQSVHIGPKHGKDTGAPHIGSRVWIGGHVSIHGKIRINDGATISVGSIVTKDVPEGCLIVGNPGRIVNRNYDNTRILGLNRL
jgi:serine O-acetyltransferase